MVFQQWYWIRQQCSLLLLQKRRSRLILFFSLAFYSFYKIIVDYHIESMKEEIKVSYYQSLIKGCKSVKQQIRNKDFPANFTYQLMIKQFFKVPPQTEGLPDYIKEISNEIQSFKKIDNSQFRSFQTQHYSISRDSMAELQYFWDLKNIQYFVYQFQLKLDQKFLAKQQQRRRKVEQSSYKQLWEKQDILNHFQIIQEIYPFSQIYQLPHKDIKNSSKSQHEQNMQYKKDHCLFLMCYLTLILKTISKSQQMKELFKVRLKLVLIYSQLQDYYKRLEDKDEPFEVKFLFGLLFLKISETQFVEALQTLFMLFYWYQLNEKEQYYRQYYRLTIYQQKNNLSFYLQTCMQVRIKQLINASLLQESHKFTKKYIAKENHISKIYFHQRKQQKPSRKWKQLLKKLHQQLQYIFGKQLQDNENFESVQLCINNHIFPQIFKDDILCSNKSQNIQYCARLQSIEKGYQKFKITHSHLFYNCQQYNIYCLLIFEDNDQKYGILNLFKSNRINIIKAIKKTYMLKIPNFNQTIEVVVVLFSKDCIKQHKQSYQLENHERQLEKFFHVLVHFIAKQRNSISLSNGIPFENILTAIDNNILSKGNIGFEEKLRYKFYKLYIERLCFLEIRTDEKQQMKTAYFVLRKVMNDLKSKGYEEWDDQPWIQRFLTHIKFTQNGGPQLFQELKKSISIQRFVNALSIQFSCNIFTYFYKACQLLYKKDLSSSALYERQRCLCALINILNGELKQQNQAIRLLLYYPALNLAFGLKQKKHLVRTQDLHLFYWTIERPYTIFASMIRSSLNDITDKLRQLGRQHFVKDEIEDLRNSLALLHPKNIPYTSDTLLNLDIDPYKILEYIECQEKCFFCKDYLSRCYQMLGEICKKVRHMLKYEKQVTDQLIERYIGFIKCLYKVEIPIQTEE